MHQYLPQLEGSFAEDLGVLVDTSPGPGMCPCSKGGQEAALRSLASTGEVPGVLCPGLGSPV